jgi:hypothetical protein
MPTSSATNQMSGFAENGKHRAPRNVHENHSGADHAARRVLTLAVPLFKK